MTDYPTVQIEGIDHMGRGVARLNGKTVFVAGALPHERVQIRLLQRKKMFDEAETVAVLQASENRVEPECLHYEQCGGCAMQHIRFDTEVAYKQRVVEEQLQRIGHIRPDYYLPPIYGYALAYRERARLKVVAQPDGQITLGFQQRRSHNFVSIEQCMVLSPAVSGYLKAWCAMLYDLQQYGGQADAIEFAVGSNSNGALLHIKSLTSKARKFLQQQALEWRKQSWEMWLQEGRNAPRGVLHDVRDLHYALPEFGVDFAFQAGDFTQVNHQTNALMVARAMALLQPQKGERIADWFCGLGNFTLPIATQGAQVVGFEGLAALTERATFNAKRNNLSGKEKFQQADLFAMSEQALCDCGQFDKWLLDPPRDGATALVQALPENAHFAPHKIVYVSCNSATLARDAAILVNKGYRLRCVGIMNLFARTAHVECMACFERQ